MFYLEVFKELNKNGISYAVVGGMAVSLHGAVRGTVDLDLIALIDRKNFKKLELALHRIGLQSKLPITAENVFDYRKEYIENRNLIAWSFTNPTNPTQIVDIIITEDLADQSVQKIKIGTIKVPLLSKSDLIKMKLKSGRKQDLEDIRALEKLK